MGAWQEVKAGDGRTYFWNRENNETTWTRPADFDDVAEPAAPAAPIMSSAEDWGEATAGDGRKYYYNKKTNKTTWEMPSEMKQQQLQQSQQQQQQPRAAAPAFVAGGASGYGAQEYGGHERRTDGRDDRAHGLPQKPSFDGPRANMPWEQRQENMGFRGPMPAKTDEPEYGSKEQAEEAFFKLLRRSNITPEMSWEDAMRSVIRDREFRAIKDPKDRKQAFERYCQDVRAQEKEKEKERRGKLREEFRKMLATHDEIRHYTRWKSARPIIEREVVFKGAGDEDERRQMFDDYVLELKKKHVIDQAEKRKTAIRNLESMLQALVVDPNSKWADARESITSNERFASDPVFQALSELDVHTAYANHVRALDRSANDAVQRVKRLRIRRERQARDDFKALLDEKYREGKIKAGSKWQHLYSELSTDPRYDALITTLPSGSTPLELFWDVVEDEERKLRTKRNDALDVLEETRYEMTLATDLDEFKVVMRSHPKTSKLREEELDMIYERLMDKIKQREEVNKMDAERHQRDSIDSLRSAIKRLEPPVRLDDSFDDIARRLNGNRDFETASAEVRRSAFDKHIRRLKDREDDRERERDRDRARRDRNRDRDHRNGSGRRGHDRERERRHRTRTPEVDAYEADRRKAQADRERQYRKASFGLTPPRERRDDRYDRDRRHERHESMSVYDRERREREMERERNYVSRADPRDKGRSLDYGDEEAVGSRPGSVRKRRDSETSISSRRESKRTRQAHTATPEAASVLKDEPPALQSGSEEGEIEEI